MLDRKTTYDQRQIGRLDRKAAADRIRLLLGKSARVLEYHVDFGLRVLALSLERSTGSKMSITATSMFRELLDAADALDAQVRAGTIGAGEIVARALLEQMVSLRYLLERNDERIAIGRVILTLQQAHEEMDDDVEHALGLMYEGHAEELRASEDYEAFKASLRSNLIRLQHSCPNALAATREIERVQAQMSGRVRWHMLFGGPQSLGALFRHVRCEPLYHAYYRSWSETSHGRGVADQAYLRLSGEGEADALVPLRNDPASEIAYLLASASAMVRIATVDMLDYFAPTQSASVANEFLYELGGRFADTEADRFVRYAYERFMARAIEIADDHGKRVTAG